MIALQLAENLINKTLVYDNNQSLSELPPTRLKIEVDLPQLYSQSASFLSSLVTSVNPLNSYATQYRFFMVVVNHRVILTEEEMTDVDATLSGKPQKIIQWMKGNSDMLGIKVSGDIVVLSKVKTVIQQMNIDVETLIADIIGDTPMALLKHSGKEILHGIRQFKR